MNAMTSMMTTVMTDIVGSFVIAQGMRPRSAAMKKYVSIFRICALRPWKKYLSEKRKMMIVNPSATPVGKAPIPAPFTNPPKNVVMETMDQTNHVYGWGLTTPRMTSLRYEILPMNAKMEAMIAMIVVVLNIDKLYHGRL